MASRLAGKLLTSPLAFLLAGLADFVGYWATRVPRPTARPRRPGSGS